MPCEKIASLVCPVRHLSRYIQHGLPGCSALLLQDRDTFITHRCRRVHPRELHTARLFTTQPAGYNAPVRCKQAALL